MNNNLRPDESCQPGSANVNLHGRATRHGLNEAGRWLALGALSLAQLMDVLENTIVNISLPSAQHDLGFSTENRQWIVTGYALAFGAFCFWGDGSLISSGVGGCP